MCTFTQKQETWNCSHRSCAVPWKVDDENCPIAVGPSKELHPCLVILGVDRPLWPAATDPPEPASSRLPNARALQIPSATFRFRLSQRFRGRDSALTTT